MRSNGNYTIRALGVRCCVLGSAAWCDPKKLLPFGYLIRVLEWLRKLQIGGDEYAAALPFQVQLDRGLREGFAV